MRDAITAQDFCQRHHEQQVLAQLEAVEAVPTEATAVTQEPAPESGRLRKYIEDSVFSAHKEAP